MGGALAAAVVAAGAVLGAGPAAAATPPPAVIATIPVGVNPHGVAVDPSSHIVYVTNYTDQTVSVIDGNTGTVTATIPVGNEPMALAVDPSSHIVYVANAGDDTVSVIDGATNAVTATIPVGSVPYGVAVDSSSHIAYVTNYNTVSVIDGATNAVTATIPVGTRAFGVAVDSSSHIAYVTNYSDGTVSVIDGATNAVTATIPVGAAPVAAAVDPSSHIAYVVNAGGYTVSVIDGATNAVTATIPVGNYPQGVAVDPATHLAYVTNYNDNTVSVIGQPVAFTAPASGSSTTDQTPAVTGTGVPGASITVTDQTAAVTGQATVAGDGTWSLTPASPIPIGPVTLTATQAIAGGQTTATTSFTIAVPPAVTQDPADQTVPAGGTATFTAAASGSAPVSVQWYESVDPQAPWNPVDGAVTGTLTVAGVSLADSGHAYRAIFTNAVGSATTAAATLTVASPPAVTQDPADQTVAAGGTARFTAAASGTASSVRWQVSTDGGATWADVAGAATRALRAAGASRTGAAGAATDTLTVAGVTVAESGHEYRVVFSNVAGSATSTVATLTVIAVASQASARQVTGPASVSDRVTVAGTRGAPGTITVELLGPAPVAGGKPDWAKAPVAGTSAPLKFTGDGTYTTSAVHVTRPGEYTFVVAVEVGGRAVSTVAGMSGESVTDLPATHGQTAAISVQAGEPGNGSGGPLTALAGAILAALAGAGSLALAARRRRRTGNG